MQEMVEYRAEKVTDLEKQLSEAKKELEAARKDQNVFEQGKRNEGWAVFLQRAGYKDAVIPINGLRISQMLRDRAYDTVITAANLGQHAGYNQWKAGNLAEFHLSGNVDALGWE